VTNAIGQQLRALLLSKAGLFFCRINLSIKIRCSVKMLTEIFDFLAQKDMLNQGSPVQFASATIRGKGAVLYQLKKEE